MHMKTTLAFVGLLLAVLDFFEKTSVLEHYLDLLMSHFEKLTYSLSRDVTKLIPNIIETLKYKRKTTAEWLWWLAMIGLFLYSPIIIGFAYIIFIPLLFCAILMVILLHIIVHVLKLLNYPKKGIVGSVGLILAFVGLFI